MRIRRAWRGIGGYFVEGFAIIAIMVAANFIGAILAAHVSKEIAHRCAVDLQRALQ
jgi:hypothetical protein